MSYGVPCLLVYRYPQMQGKHGNPVTCNFEGWSADERFAAHLADTYGVLGGTTIDNKEHAVNWRDGRIFDPRTGRTYSLIGFKPFLYIRVGPISQPLLLHKPERVRGRFGALFNQPLI